MTPEGSCRPCSHSHYVTQFGSKPDMRRFAGPSCEAFRLGAADSWTSLETFGYSNKDYVKDLGRVKEMIALIAIRRRKGHARRGEKGCWPEAFADGSCEEAAGKKAEVWRRPDWNSNNVDCVLVEEQGSPWQRRLANCGEAQALGEDLRRCQSCQR